MIFPIKENESNYYFVLIVSVAATLKYVRVGCYKDRIARRAMTALLGNYRNQIDWNDLKTSVVDKCAFEVIFNMH